MKPFRLITLERLRSRELDARAQELHVVAQAKSLAEAERERLARQLADGGGAGAGIGSWTGADLDLANNFRQVLRQLIVDEHERIATLDRSIDTARAAWLEARSRLRAVQTLHDRHRTQVRAEQTRLDQRELDERAGTRRPTGRELPAGPKVGVR